MNDSITDDLRQPIDARPLNADEAMRGAVVGFVCSLLGAVPLGFFLWKESLLDAPGAAAVAVLVVAVGTCGPAVVCACLRRESILTDEQRAIIRTHQRRAVARASFIVVPFALLSFAGIYYTGTYILFPAASCMKLACLAVASLVGRANGRAVVAEMRRSARSTAGATGGRWSNDRQPSPSSDAGPERERLRLSDRDRVADARPQSRAKSFGDLGEED